MLVIIPYKKKKKKEFLKFILKIINFKLNFNFFLCYTAILIFYLLYFIGSQPINSPFDVYIH